MVKADYCQHCSWLFDKMGACQPPQALFIFSILSFIPYILIFIFCGLTLFSRKHRQLKMAILLISSYLIGDKLMKNIIQSPRPEGSCKETFGFPSSHMTVMTCYALGVWLHCRKSQKMFLLILVILQGFARVQLKYHTWEQVVGGIAFAIVYGLIF